MRALACILALCAVAPAAASPRLRLGVVDSTEIVYGNPDRAFRILHRLHVQVIRVNLTWGGDNGVVMRRPWNGANPRDPAYRWGVIDRTVRFASQYRIRVLFSIYGTPQWANGGRGANVVPDHAYYLERFARAAALRYPSVRLWLAWNEPNNPIFLTPQYRRAGGRWIVQSASDYARICRAIYDGVHSAGKRETVGCGATAPRGNDAPRSSRPSIDPISFLRALYATGIARFDAWDHHPYNFGAAPDAPPLDAHTISLGNVNELIGVLTQLYGPKPVWIGEYGYETRPPDNTFGVSYVQQAAYLRDAVAIAHANPRIDLLIWFLVKDETRLSGWQSGFITAGGTRKPSFYAFARLTRAGARSPTG